MKTGRTFWDFLTEVMTDPIALLYGLFMVGIVTAGIVEVAK